MLLINTVLWAEWSVATIPGHQKRLDADSIGVILEQTLESEDTEKLLHEERYSKEK